MTWRFSLSGNMGQRAFFLAVGLICSGRIHLPVLMKVIPSDKDEGIFRSIIEYKYSCFCIASQFFDESSITLNMSKKEAMGSHG
jgi:hypothetical protein